MEENKNILNIKDCNNSELKNVTYNIEFGRHENGEKKDFSAWLK